MKIFNCKSILSSTEHTLLTEALRRRTRFYSSADLHSITEQWTGLGTPGEYAPAIKAGLMRPAKPLNPRRGQNTWFKLTDKGALIIAYWIGQGFTHMEIETNKLPSPILPAWVTATGKSSRPRKSNPVPVPVPVPVAQEVTTATV